MWRRRSTSNALIAIAADVQGAKAWRLTSVFRHPVADLTRLAAGQVKPAAVRAMVTTSRLLLAGLHAHPRTACAPAIADRRLLASCRPARGRTASPLSPASTAAISRPMRPTVRTSKRHGRRRNSISPPLRTTTFTRRRCRSTYRRREAAGVRYRAETRRGAAPGWMMPDSPSMIDRAPSEDGVRCWPSSTAPWGGMDADRPEAVRAW